MEPARYGRRSTRSRAAALSLPSTRRRGSSAQGARCSPARAKRVRPGLDDDKILTVVERARDRGLARAARALDEPRWADLALAATDALRAHRVARRPAATRRAQRRARAVSTRYLDDYAFLLAALLELMQTRFRQRGLRLGVRARRCALLARFEDTRARRLLVHEPRPRDAFPSDEARPRQRDAVGQRRRGAGADRARTSRVRAALSRRRRAHGAVCSRPRSRGRRVATRHC